MRYLNTGFIYNVYPNTGYVGYLNGLKQGRIPMVWYLNVNKTGLQDLWNESLGFFKKGFNAKNGAKMCSKNVKKIMTI